MKHELQLHGHCEELPLKFLSVVAVGDFLARRFPRHRFPPELALILHRNTDGNPLFVVNTIDYLIARGQLQELDGQWGLSASVALGEVESGIPETLAQMVQTHVERLSADEQALLAVASVAGAAFSAAIAPAAGIATEDAERLCEGLALRGQFLRATGLVEWPDGTVAGRYAFIHALYRHVLYQRVSHGHRVGLHLRIGAPTEHGLRPFLMLGEIHRGWVLSEQGRGQEGLAAIRQGLAASRDIGLELRRPDFLARLAEASAKVEPLDEGLAAVDEALAVGHRTGQHYWDAELHRLKGALTLQSVPGPARARSRSPARGDTPDLGGPWHVEGVAETCFLEAIAIAQRQRAKSFELRAATSLSQLWARQGRGGEARALLSGVYGWFSEGFETADLKEANALLKELDRGGMGKSKCTLSRRQSRK
jgi:hypothetical protein